MPHHIGWVIRVGKFGPAEYPTPNSLEKFRRCKGSPTVAYTVAHTVVWRNSMVWCTGGNTALWLVGKLTFFVCVQYEFPGYGFLSQSQHRICPHTSNPNHGFLPHDIDSVNYTGLTPPNFPTNFPISQFSNFSVRDYTACVSVLYHEYMFRVRRLGPEVHDLAFQGLGFRVCSSGFRVFRVFRV